jgi:hypothetical protein
MVAILALLATVMFPPPQPVRPTLPVFHGPAAPIDRALQIELDRRSEGVANVVVRAKSDQLPYADAAVRGYGGKILARDVAVRSVTVAIDLRVLEVLRHHPAVASLALSGGPSVR